MCLGIPLVCTVRELSAPQFQTLLYLLCIIQPNYVKLNSGGCGGERAGRGTGEGGE